MSSMLTPVWSEVGQCYTFKGLPEGPFFATETGRVTHHRRSQWGFSFQPYSGRSADFVLTI